MASFERVSKKYGRQQRSYSVIFKFYNKYGATTNMALQQVWRWLYEKEHGISKDERVVIMKLFRAVLYGNDFQSYEKGYKDLAELKNTKTASNILRNYSISVSPGLDASGKISW